MNVTLNRRILLDALETARKWVAPSKYTPPICHAALLRTDGDVVELWRTDLDRQAVVALDATISRHGEAAVSAHALYRIAKTSRATALELKLEPPMQSIGPPAEQVLTVRAGTATYCLVTAPGGDAFPGAEVRSTPNLARNLPASSLRWLLGATVYAAGKDKSATDCVELRFDAGTLRAIATDGHRAALSDLVRVDTVREDPLYLPGDSAARLLAQPQECMVGIALTDDKRLHFTLGRQTFLSCRTLDRTFPDVDRVVQRYEGGGEEVVAQREQLLAALDRATAVLGGAPVRLAAGLDQVTVSGEALGSRVVEYLPARAGTECAVHVNPHYAIEALQALTSSEVSLRISAEALTVRPVLQDEITQRQLAIVMPVRTEEEEARTEPGGDRAPGEPEPTKKRARKAKS